MVAGAALGLLVVSSAPAVVLSFLIPVGIGGLPAGIPGRRARPAVDRSRDGGRRAQRHASALSDEDCDRRSATSATSKKGAARARHIRDCPFPDMTHRAEAARPVASPRVRGA